MAKSYARNEQGFNEFLKDMEAALVKDACMSKEQAAWVINQQSVINMLLMPFRMGMTAKKAALVTVNTLAESFVRFNMEAEAKK